MVNDGVDNRSACQSMFETPLLAALTPPQFNSSEFYAHASHRVPVAQCQSLK